MISLNQFLLQLIIFLFRLNDVTSFTYELTINVPPGNKECFYQQINSAPSKLEVEYQVLEGAGLDINFIARSPNEEILAYDARRSENNYVFTITTKGLCEICFDNSFSTFSSKLVFFDVYSELPDDTFPKRIDTFDRSDVAEELMELSVAQFKSYMDSIMEKLDRSEKLQTAIGSYTKQDRSVQEENFFRVNLFSGIQLFVMVSVALVQVMMIRGLFETTPTTTKSFKAST